VVITNFAPIFSYLEIFIGHSNANHSASDGFQIFSIGCKGHFFPEKKSAACKQHLYRPTSTDAVSCWSSLTTYRSCQPPSALQTKTMWKTSVFVLSRPPTCVVLFLPIIFNVRQSYCAHFSYRLDICPSVCVSVTCWFCVETAQPIVKLSSLSSLPGSPMHDSSFMGTKLFSGIPMKTPNTPTGALNARG